MGKLNPGTKEGDGAVVAAFEHRCGIRSEPGFPNGIGKRPSLWVNIAHGVVGSGDHLWLLLSVPKDDGAHVFIRAPHYRGSLLMPPRVLPIEQDGYTLLRDRIGFFLRDLLPCGERNVEVITLLQRQPLWQF